MVDTFNVEFESLNEALEKLPYARVYQSPMDKKNEFNIEVRHENGGTYKMLEQLIKLAEKEGYKYDRYYEMNHYNGAYTYTAEMYHETKTVRCSFTQDRVYTID